MSEDVAASAVHDASRVHLLPGFDDDVLGYKDRRDVLAPDHASKIVPGNDGIFLPAIVVGQVVGIWKRTRMTNALRFTLFPFAPLVMSNESIAAAQRYGDFIGAPAVSIEVAGA